MPTRGLKPCAQPGCPALVEHGRCPRHRPPSTDPRPSAARRGYDRHWRRISAAFLKANPVCVDCGHPSSQADHAPVTRRELVAAGVEHPDAWVYLQARCRPCHSARTARTSSGWGGPQGTSAASQPGETEEEE